MATDLENKLNEMLVKVIENLIKHGLLPELSASQKKELLSQVSENLIKNSDISLDDILLRRENTFKALGLACMAQNNPGHQFDYTLLFKPQTSDNKDELTSELKKLLDSVLKPRLEMRNKPLSKEEKKALDEKIDALVESLVNHMVKHDPNSALYENQKMFNSLALFVDMETILRRNLYGAGQPGEILQPIVCQPIGDILGVVDLAPDISGGSFMSQKDNPNTPDPLGFKIDELFKELANDPIDTPFESMVLFALDPNTPKLTSHH